MEVIEKLTKIGFTETMAMVYVELLRESGLNGTQIFKRLNIPRTSVYNALSQLEQRKIITLIPTETDMKNYIPCPPSEVLRKINQEYTNILETIGLDLEKIYRPSSFNEVYNISGIDNLYYKINAMLEYAKNKIIISGRIVETKLVKTGLDIIRKDLDNENIYVLVDDSELLVAKLSGEYAVGIYTKNSLIISRYI